MKILELTQGSPEWHEHRKTSLGATTASVLAMCNPWKKPWDLYEEMVEGKVTPMNDSMRKGVEMEEEARAWAEDQLEVSLFPVTAQSTDIKYMHASFDGFSLDGSIAVEIKCSKKTYDEAVKGHIPSYYYLQMQQQMFVGHLKFMYYVCYWDGKGFLQKVERNLEDVKNIVERAKRFYIDHLLPRVAPSKDNGKNHPLNTLDDDSRSALLINIMNRQDIVNQIKHLENLKEALDAQIFSEVKESCEIGKWKLTKSIIKGSIDWSKVCKDMKINEYNLDSYRKPSREQWRIR